MTESNQRTAKLASIQLLGKDLIIFVYDKMKEVSWVRLSGWVKWPHPDTVTPLSQTTASEPIKGCVQI